MTDAAALARDVAFFEQISAHDVARLGEIYAADAYFRDPFNDLRGVDAIARVYARMFEQLDDCRFVIVDTVASKKGALLIWDFAFPIRLGDHASDRPFTARHTSNLLATKKSAITAATGAPRKSSMPSRRCSGPCCGSSAGDWHDAF